MSFVSAGKLPLLSLLSMVTICSVLAADVTLVSDGKAMATIHIPQEATLQEQFAAEELQKYIAKASGATLEVRQGKPSSDETAVVVALSDRLGLVGVTATEAEKELSAEGISNRIDGTRVIISGGGKRGIVYAAYNFLERLGYRWYWPGELGEVTPDLKDIVISDLSVLHEPSFKRRHAIGRADDGGKDKQFNIDLADWLTKNRQNFWVGSPPYDDCKDFMIKRGGTMSKIGSGHNFQHIIKSSLFFKDHPEWFALNRGKRIPNGQPCLTHPEVIKRLTDYAMKGAEAMARNPDYMFIDMTQNDFPNNWCECERCKAIDDKDPGTKADILLWTLNQIAERVTAKYPDAILFTFAYVDSLPVPKHIRPHKSIMIEQTNYCYNYGASFLNPAAHRTQIFKKHLDSWAEITNLHGIYEYFGFYNWLEALPVTLFRLQDEVRYYKKIGVHGFYSETQQRWSTNHLLYYAFSRLWWDHTTDVKPMMKEFFQLFYGPAATPMRDFYMALETSGGVNRYWSGDEFNLTSIYSQFLRYRCRGYLNRAKRLAKDDPKVLARLAFVELGWKYTELHLEAMDAQNVVREVPTKANAAKARKAWQAYVDYFDTLKGTHAFSEKDLPNFKARAEQQLKAYTLDLAASPSGKFYYSDKYTYGGNAKLHGKVEGFSGEMWGLRLDGKSKGSVVYELAAEKGRVWKDVKVTFRGEWGSHFRNAVEYSLDGKSWTAILTNGDLRDADVDKLSAGVEGANRFWVRCRYENRGLKQNYALYDVRISGVIE